MSKETEKDEVIETEAKAPVSELDVPSEPAVGAIVPSGVVLSGATFASAAFFDPWAFQTLNGTLVSGVIVPAASGNGWGGQNNAGFVFQYGQYNTTVRGF